MDYTKKNGVLVPKQRLFAPMLSTFGGGSIRGFMSGGKLEAPDFSTVTGTVHSASTEQLVRVNVNSFNGSAALVENTNFQLRGSFPANLMDVAWGLESPDTVRIVGSKLGGSNLVTIPVNFTSSTSVVDTTNSTDLNNIRGLCMCRNGIFVTACTTNTRLTTWKLNSDSTFTKLSHLSDGTNLVTIQCIINPDDGATLGDDTIIFVASASGGSFRAYQIASDGTITFKQSQSLPSSGKQIILSPMKSSNANSVRIMALPPSNDIKVYDYNYSSHQFTLFSTGFGFSASDGDPHTATPGHGGFTYVGTKLHGGTGTFFKFYQNGTYQDSFQNASLNGSYINGMLAIDDGTSGAQFNGNIYWVSYNQGSSPERRVMRTNDRNQTGFANSIQTGNILGTNAYGLGGGVIGERPKYAEFDAKLASANW